MKTLVAMATFYVVTVFVAGCATMGSSQPAAVPGFTPKVVESGGIRIEVNSMCRGQMTRTMRVDKDTKTFDAVFFDIVVSNVGSQDLMATGVFFQLITEDGEVTQGSGIHDGGFDGGLGTTKSISLYPGTKKSGSIAFGIKKTTQPKTLIFDCPMGKKLTIEL